MIDIKISRAPSTRINEVDFSHLGFGKEFTDHIFIADFDGQNWKDFRIVPFGPLSFSPSLSCIHYGQSIFEGMKAYRGVNDEIQIFRPLDNFKRINESAVRMCMQPIPKDVFIEGLKAYCRIDSDWISSNKDCALYLRPFLIATDETLGIRPSDRYSFMICGCAVGAYYNEPLKVKIETKYVRSCPGGVGEAKTAGNYAAALYATSLAQKEGFNQIIWTDAIEHKYLEELGTSNVFILSGNTLITPATNGTVLRGITRNSIIQLANHLGFKVEERRISVEEVLKMNADGILDEAFATGTAASVTPIGEMSYNGVNIILKAKENSVALMLKDKLENIKRNKEEDIFGWNEKVDLAVGVH